MTATKQAIPRLAVPTRAALAAALGIRLPKLNYWLYSVPLDHRYKRFELKRKGDRPPRLIEAPIKPIKDIQQRLLRLLEREFRPHYAVHGYVHGKSIVTNAAVHVEQRWVLRVDLADFFPSINFGRVRGLFLAAPFLFPSDVATVAAHLCCHRNHLPQGAPTSPLISNLVCRRLDRQLGELAIAARCFYSRYCDDLIFSTDHRAFPPSLAITDPQTDRVVAGTSLQATVTANGFTINAEKTRLRGYSQRQVVTGLVTNKFVNVPRNEVRSLRNVLYIWAKYGETAAAASLDRYRHKNRPPRKPASNFRLVVRGKIQYVGFIKKWDSGVYASLAGRLRRVDATFRPRDSTAGITPASCIIYVEGKTDHLHLDAALAHFKGMGRFTDLLIDHGTAAEGDQVLFERCKALATTIHHSVPMIFMFDRDNLSLLPKVTDATGSVKSWGNNVFSFAIPIPSFREGTARLCLEMLYPDEVLQRRDANGRRIYLRAEFDPENGHHLVEDTYCINPKRPNLVPEDEVFSSDGKTKMSLSKVAFAQAIAERRPPFAGVSFDGFSVLFDTLIQIRNIARDGPKVR